MPDIKLPDTKKAAEKIVDSIAASKSTPEKFFQETMKMGTLFDGVENRVVDRQIVILRRSAKELVRKIKGIDPAESLRAETRERRLKESLAVIRDDLGQAYEKMGKEIGKDLLEIAEFSAGVSGDTLDSVLPFPFDHKRLTKTQLKSLVVNAPFGGTNDKPPRMLAKWMESQKAATITKVSNHVEAGMVQGESTQQITKRILIVVKGISEFNAETIARTAVAHINNGARLEIYRANDDVIKGVRLSTARDPKTCPECAMLSLGMYPLDQIPKEVPIHPKCRCDWVPVTKTPAELGFTGKNKGTPESGTFNLGVPKESFKKSEIESWLKKQGVEPTEEPQTKNELLEQVKEVISGYSGALAGQVPKDVPYPKWFQDQPDFFHKTVLDPKRYELFKKGKLSYSDLYNPLTKRFYSLKDLKEKIIPELKKKG